jgi:hypothetical protein
VTRYRSSGIAKGNKRGKLGLFKGEVNLGEGLGLRRDRTAMAEAVLGEESGQRREMTCGPHMSEREREERGTDSVKG